jgi:hypothetical protein
MAGDAVDFRPQLITALERANVLLSTIRGVDPTRFVFRAAIIDHHNPDGWRQLDVQGYLKAILTLEKHAAGLHAVSPLRSGRHTLARVQC